MPRGIGTSTGVKLTRTVVVGEAGEVLDDLGRVPVRPAHAVRRGRAHHLAAEQVRLGRLAGTAGAGGRDDHEVVGLDEAGGDGRREGQRGDGRVAAGDRDPARAFEQRRAGRGARAGRRARTRRARSRRTSPSASASVSRKSAPQSITTASSPSCSATAAGLAVRQREEDDVVTGQRLGVRLLEDPVGQRHQVGLQGTEALARVGPGGERADLDVGMGQQQAQHLAAGVPAGSGDGDTCRGHVHDYTEECMSPEPGVACRTDGATMEPGAGGSIVADNWADGNAYEHFMGRWSRLVAPRFVALAEAARPVCAGSTCGCGTGALTAAVLTTPPRPRRCWASIPARVDRRRPADGIDGSARRAPGRRRRGRSRASRRRRRLRSGAQLRPGRRKRRSPRWLRPRHRHRGGVRLGLRRPDAAAAHVLGRGLRHSTSAAIDRGRGAALPVVRTGGPRRPVAADRDSPTCARRASRSPPSSSTSRTCGGPSSNGTGPAPAYVATLDAPVPATGCARPTARMVHPDRDGHIRMHARGVGPCAGRRPEARCSAPCRCGRQRDGGVASRGGLLLGQGAVGRPEAQREGQRLAALADLLAGVDVEEPYGLAQRPGALPQRGRQLGRREVGVDDRARRPPWRPGRPRTAAPWPTATARASRASRSSSAADVRGGTPKAWQTRGCSSPAWPTAVSPRTSSAHRPGCHGATLGRRTDELEPERVGDDAGGLDDVAPGRRTALAPPAGAVAVAGRRRPRCSGWSGSALLRSSHSPSVGRRSTGRIGAPTPACGRVTGPSRTAPGRRCRG